MYTVHIHVYIHVANEVSLYCCFNCSLLWLHRLDKHQASLLAKIMDMCIHASPNLHASLSKAR